MKGYLTIIGNVYTEYVLDLIVENIKSLKPKKIGVYQQSDHSLNYNVNRYWTFIEHKKLHTYFTNKEDLIRDSEYLIAIINPKRLNSFQDIINQARNKGITVLQVDPTQH